MTRPRDDGPTLVPGQPETTSPTVRDEETPDSRVVERAEGNPSPELASQTRDDTANRATASAEDTCRHLIQDWVKNHPVAGPRLIEDL